MSTNYHTPLSTTELIPASGATINAPMSELDAELTAQDGRIAAVETTLPPLSNDPDEFLNGQGAFAVPAGTGSTNGHVIQDDGSSMTQRTNLNFVGFSVTDEASATRIEAIPPREQLTAARTYYVRADGDDGNDGLANTSGGAWLTIQHAVDVIASQLDLGNYDVTVQIGAGTYDQVEIASFVAGSGRIILSGASAATVTIDGATAAAITISGTIPTAVQINYIKLTSTGTYAAIKHIGSGIVLVGAVDFGNASAGHVYCDGVGATVYLSGSYDISYQATEHLYARCGEIITGAITITLVGASQAYSIFAYAAVGGKIISRATFAGTSATGKRYQAELCGVIDTNGAGANYFPGNAAGTTATGGQYA